MKISRPLYTVLVILLTAILGWSLFMGWQDIENAQREIQESSSEQDKLDSLRADILEQPEAVPPDLLEDYRGWLTVPGTDIDFPVMQAADNKFYLKHSYDGSPDSRGSLFLDYGNTLADANLVIHGHNLGYAGMLSQLLLYEQEEFARSHPSFYFTADAEKREFRVFAVMLFDVTNLEKFDYMAREFDEGCLAAWLDYIDQNSLYRLGKLPNGSRQLMTLSTCTTAGKTDMRIIVFGEEIRQ